MKLLCALLLALSAAVAQADNGWAETRELTLAGAGVLDAETPVGNIVVEGWDKDYILVRATVTNPLVQINVSTTRLWATAPSGESWSASYEIFVPRRSGLHAYTHVGKITASGVIGTISLLTNVGSIAFANLGGDVTATTHVGAIAATLTGAAWEGKGLSLTASTGAIHITAPAAYAARFDLRTNMGAIATNAPGARVTTAGLFGRKLLYGAGDALIHASTSMGEITLRVE